MTADLRAAIHAELQQQQYRFVNRYKLTHLAGRERAENAYWLSDLGTCRRTIEAALDFHAYADADLVRVIAVNLGITEGLAP